MPMFDEKHVKIEGCFIVWDGVTRPDQNPDGSPKYSLKVVVDPNSPDLALFNQVCVNALNESEFKGQLPAGGRMAIGQAQAHEYNGLFPGFGVLNCNTNRVPDVFDENGNRLEPMQYGPLLYGGQRVDVVVHAYAYNKAGNKGIATGLDGFGVIVSAQAPQQSFGGGGVDVSAAFGGGGMAPQGQPGMAPQGQPGMAPQGQPGMAPQGQPGMAPQGQPGMAPQGQPGMAPQGQQGQPGMVAQGQPGMAPQGQPGMQNTQFFPQQ